MKRIMKRIEHRLLFGSERHRERVNRHPWLGKIPYPLIIPFSITSFLVTGTVVYA